MDYNAIIDAQIEKGRTVEITPDGTIRIHAPQQQPQQQSQPPQAPQPEPEAAPATVEGLPPAPDSDSECSEDPEPDDDETAPYHDRPPAEDDDVSLSPTEIEAPAPGDEEDAPPAPAPPAPAPAPAQGQLADPTPPMEDPDQEAGAEKKGYNREHASTIHRAKELLAKGHKVNLTSAKVDVLREALRLWRCSDLVLIRCNTGKIDVIKGAIALGMDIKHIKCTTVDPAVEQEAKGLLPEDRVFGPNRTVHRKKYFTEEEKVTARRAYQKKYNQNKGKVTRAKYYQSRQRSRKRARILAAKPTSSKRAKLNADGAETPQERQPLGENRQAVDVGLPRAYYPLGPSPSLVKT